jgi:hypothetical protein
MEGEIIDAKDFYKSVYRRQFKGKRLMVPQTRHHYHNRRRLAAEKCHRRRIARAGQRAACGSVMALVL